MWFIIKWFAQWFSACCMMKLESRVCLPIISTPFFTSIGRRTRTCRAGRWSSMAAPSVEETGGRFRFLLFGVATAAFTTGSRNENAWKMNDKQKKFMFPVPFFSESSSRANRADAKRKKNKSTLNLKKTHTESVELWGFQRFFSLGLVSRSWQRPVSSPLCWSLWIKRLSVGIGHSVRENDVTMNCTARLSRFKKINISSTVNRARNVL